jgi:uncharacterized repeat protein (TIGR01451 family)
MMPHAISSPTWLRLAVVALAALVLCSCRAAGPEYRIAGAADGAPGIGQLVGGDADADPASQQGSARGQRPLPQVKLASAEEAIPTHLTEGQVARGAELPANFQAPPCGPGGCPCGGCGAGGAGGHIRGPNDEYLCDGGDDGPPAAVVKTGEVAGVQPEDAVAHYDTVDGRTIITPSNKVCIYAPRFAAVRQVVDPRALADADAAEGAIRDLASLNVGKDQRSNTTLAGLKPNIDRAQEPPSLLRGRNQAGELDRDRRVAATIGSLAPYCNVQTVRTGEVVGRDIAQLARSSLAALAWTSNQAAQVVLDSRKAHAEVGVKTPGTIYLLVEPNHPKLRLIKLASASEARSGEEVEFTLRFDNIGDRVIGNVVIIDSLTTRLEYVDQSQKASVAAEFSSQANGGDSLSLRWEIQEPLQVGEGGVIQFRTRVR